MKEKVKKFVKKHKDALIAGGVLGVVIITAECLLYKKAFAAGFDRGLSYGYGEGLDDMATLDILEDAADE